jgi:hypothetical protein
VTEAEWLSCTDPETMLQFVRGNASDRKLRLFACACCRRVGYLLDGWSQNLVDVVEQYVDGSVGRSGLAFATDLHDDVVQRAKPYTARHIAANMVNAAKAGAAWAAAWTVVGEARRAIRFSEQGDTLEESRAQAALLREVLGNPFRPVTVAPAVRTPTVVALAQAIYARGSLARLPELAVALEAASCTDDGLLAHFRGLGPHVRGCFALDLILGKA